MTEDIIANLVKRLDDRSSTDDSIGVSSHELTLKILHPLTFPEALSARRIDQAINFDFQSRYFAVFTPPD